ncbi:helix-turn-helix domain-containing protein [Carboxylicivirga marina]|uniref:helix-turn-helix domain-containing protein n=1 Tax=Carboxylicivirga marina TaxID=2800988 RepID=UPI00259354A4|nr:helix-turn-helix transcriptional regulator [uncultured Carboxylicivirga sp.]
MLRYNFTRIFKAKAIERPYTYLCKAGFSENFSSKVKNNLVNRLNLDLLERLCECFGCTPNDLMEWVPDKGSPLKPDHPLNELRRNEKILDLTAAINSLPLSKLEKIEKLISDE